MKYDLRRPCPDCPFRVDEPGYLRTARAADIVNGLLSDDWSAFACHKTTVVAEDPETGLMDRVRTPDTQHCAGAMIFLLHNDSPSVGMRMQAAMGLFDYDELDMDAPVARTAQEFIDHHAACWLWRNQLASAGVHTGGNDAE